MLDPAAGPYLFDTSAEGWLLRSRDPGVQRWLRTYLLADRIHVSSVTVLERIRGYGLLAQRAPDRREHIESSRVAYLSTGGTVLPVDAATAVVSGEIMALLPQPPTTLKRSHRHVESHQERVSRWRFEILIASTALVAGLTLIHNNAADFEAIRTVVEVSPQRFPKLGPLNLIRCESLV